MVVADPLARPAAVGRRTIDIAGTPWPVYKLEALALGVAVFLLLVLITGSLQVAVLSGAAAAALRWIAGAVRGTGSQRSHSRHMASSAS
ncbi:hypothetical protein [Nocardia sp. BMG51109]|uniref:hypothetical protein n=1 Tax=Nocardia sp. BMG51109 TaxID=1056816 RepID=UPI000465A76C|nr:hypothetical protein [Nocardia sp. BMG51109]